MKKAKIWDARQLPAFLTPKEYSALMGIDQKTVQKMCRSGQLPAHKEGPRLWRIDKNAALAWQKELEEHPPEQKAAHKTRRKKEKPARAGTRTRAVKPNYPAIWLDGESIPLFPQAVNIATNERIGTKW